MVPVTTNQNSIYIYIIILGFAGSPKKYHTHNRDSPENGGSSGKFSEAPLLQLLVLLLQQIPAVSAIYWLKLVISGIIYFISGYSSVLITGKGP